MPISDVTQGLAYSKLYYKLYTWKKGLLLKGN